MTFLSGPSAVAAAATAAACGARAVVVATGIGAVVVPVRASNRTMVCTSNRQGHWQRVGVHFSLLLARKEHRFFGGDNKDALCGAPLIDGRHTAIISCVDLFSATCFAFEMTKI